MELSREPVWEGAVEEVISCSLEDCNPVAHGNDVGLTRVALPGHRDMVTCLVDPVRAEPHYGRGSTVASLLLMVEVEEGERRVDRT